ncbi:uncharacterized protein EDB93DRAFT_404795 [Suillus bovinus]|uniref:uncharacterized protein n=1 Tax=Suillus bovinus TaxID=48563 RepID=UPI001B872FA4|nr:uncharacterized protein EDB93DRAFT_404795 [Suillus bovinus]KAG2147787.1 hypothetical protein EDB93DRAFT_404795 [Suillus bovinus]
MYPLLLACLLFTCQCSLWDSGLGSCGRNVYKSPEITTSNSSTNFCLSSISSSSNCSLYLLLVKVTPSSFLHPKSAMDSFSDILAMLSASKTDDDKSSSASSTPVEEESQSSSGGCYCVIA